MDDNTEEEFVDDLPFCCDNNADEMTDEDWEELEDLRSTVMEQAYNPGYDPL